jgi:hypothetical protein
MRASMTPPTDNATAPSFIKHSYARICGVRTSRVIQFRHHAAMAVAGVIVALAGVFPVADVGLPALPIMIVPLLFSVWAWRAGTDADPDGIKVRALLGNRRIAWPSVAALIPDERGRVLASLTDGTAVPLTAVRAEDLPRLVAASGHQLGQ